MLILSRREGESLMIGDSIEIMTIRISGKKVRIGIRAPKEIMVHRMEVYQKIKMDKDNMSPPINENFPKETPENFV